MMNIKVVGIMFGLALMMIGCKSPETNSLTQEAKHIEKIAPNTNLDSLTTKLVYVPAYSQVYSMNTTKKGALVNLSVTLSLRNTDFNNSLIIKSIKYYNSEGSLLKDFIDHPMELSAMATENYFIPANDKSGGIGANFVVEWTSEKEITSPYIEALMLGGLGNYGYSWASEGYPLNY
ncbi:MAG: DUF3124 domain-containing protein [Salibacteraceae bacterium]